MDLPPPLDLVAATFSDACDRAGIAYAFVGGLAAGAYGSAWATLDVDACVALGQEDEGRIAALLSDLQASGFRINVAAIKRRVARGHGVLFLMIGVRRLDIVLLKPGTLWEDVLRHRRRCKIEGGREFWLAAPEELVVTKLAAGREKDMEAVRKITGLHFPSLDLPRMRAAVAKLAPRAPELPGRLEALIEEARELDRLASEPPSDE